ncbi:hypothetical protein LTR56_009035 [Elasticomyces elasticus]|nr:hypothetical protein LTR56_009035 [Elasticomyces elasticus]KAK3663836.1 hypothetical protein LTR22_005297 [Elasticomyces elasticus]KAK5762168.1 hypothetical protein LTS12_007689 [Elasticomyces elasticus]
MSKARKERRLKAATRPSRLLTLPTELLVQIIEYYIEAIDEVHILADGAVCAVALAQTCRQLHHEVTPIWHAQQKQHLKSPKQIKCLVNNFDFSAILSVFEQMPEPTRHTIMSKKVLQIYLTVDERQVGRPSSHLKEWLEAASNARIPATYQYTMPPRLGLSLFLVAEESNTYHFTKPLVKVSMFAAAEDEISSMHCSRFQMEREEWGAIRQSYNAVLVAVHNSQSAGSKMYREWIRCQERRTRDEQERFRKVGYGKSLSLGFR